MAAGLKNLEEDKFIVIERTRTEIFYPPFVLRWHSTKYIAFEVLHSVFPNQVLHGTMGQLQLPRRRWKARTYMLGIFDCILRAISLASSRDMLPVLIPSRT